MHNKPKTCHVQIQCIPRWLNKFLVTWSKLYSRNTNISHKSKFIDINNVTHKKLSYHVSSTSCIFRALQINTDTAACYNNECRLMHNQPTNQPTSVCNLSRRSFCTATAACSTFIVYLNTRVTTATSLSTNWSLHSVTDKCYNNVWQTPISTTYSYKNMHTRILQIFVKHAWSKCWMNKYYCNEIHDYFQFLFNQPSSPELLQDSFQSETFSKT